MSSPEELVQVTLDGHLVTMPRSLADQANQKGKLKIDGKEVEVPQVSLSYDPVGRPVPRLTTIYDAALKVYPKDPVPVLCHREYMTPVAVCRVCSVEVGWGNGPQERKLAPACYRPVAPGMVVATHRTSEWVKRSVKTL